MTTQSASRFNILLVDDRTENLVALEAVLSDLGQNVVKARSGKEALRQLLQHEFIVILLDVNMPEMDGFETAALIRQRRKTEYTPIIFVTAATTSEELRTRGYSLGAVDYLFTPIEPHILRAKVAAFVELAHKAEAARTHVEDERAAAEKRAARLESRLQSLFNRLDVGIFRSEPDGRLLDANPALLRLLGLGSVEEARQRVAGRDGERWLQQLFAFPAGVQPLLETAIELPQTGGKALYASVTKMLNSEPDGERFVEGLVTDITRRKHAETEREHLLASERQARSDAELANRLKDEFLATLSHELRTPLHAILGWSEALGQTEIQVEERRLGLAAIKRNAMAQTRLIDDLLDMSRIMSGKLRLELTRVELPGVIEAAIESLAPAIEAKRLQLERDFRSRASTIVADAGRMQQVIGNLLSNAIKFSDESGRVTVALDDVGTSVRISVSDAGIGIRPDFLSHIFGRFRQADSSSTRQHGGLGLGLAIVKNLVDMHGGTVRAHSDGLGRGARFEVLVPIGDERADALRGDPREWHYDAAAREPGRESRLQGIQVLVVDDIRDARDLIRFQLEQCGASVRTAESALQALDLLKRKRPDVLVSDIGMAGHDGYHLIERVRALPADEGGRLPAVAITAFARFEDRMRALQSGFQEHLVKPVESWRLIQTVDRLAREATGERQNTVGT